MRARSQAEAGPAMDENFSVPPRAAKRSMKARRRANESKMAIKARPPLEKPYPEKCAATMKTAMSAAHRVSMGKKASWRAVGKRILYRNDLK